MNLPAPILLRNQFIRHRSRIDLVRRYVAGQGLLQLLNVLNGFFLLRWLSVDEQAKFSLAMGLQATLSVLGDLGFGGSLVGLVGNRTDDRRLIGQYVAGIRQFKDRFLGIGLLVGIVAVVVWGRKQAWGGDLWLIYGLLIVSVYAQSMSGYHAAILQMKKELTAFYKPQIVAAGLRLLAGSVLYVLLGLNARQAVLLTTAAFVLNAVWLRRYACRHVEPTPPGPNVRREIVATLGPVIPMVIFYAIQGQVVLFLAGYFGKAGNLAEIGALSRINQLFALLTPFNLVVLLPFLAQSPASQRIRRYALVLLAGIAVVSPIVALSYWIPGPFVWLLGPHYASLTDEIGPYVLASAVWYLTSIVWAVNAAQTWNHWTTSLFYVLLLTSIQIGGVYALDLSQTSQLVRLSLYLAGGTLLAYGLVSAVGYGRQQRNQMITIDP